MRDLDGQVTLETKSLADPIPVLTPDAGDPSMDADVIADTLLCRNKTDLGERPAATTIRVGLVDPYAFTRECIGRALEARNRNIIIELFNNLAEVKKAQAVVDVLLYHWQGAKQQECGLQAEFPAIGEAKEVAPVIILSNVDHPNVIRHAFSKGVSGYVTTIGTPLNLLAEIIRLVMAGGTFIPITGLPLDNDNPQSEIVTDADRLFTSREKAVLNLLKAGKANKIIAHELVMSESTVKVHVRSIMRKMNARNRTEAVSRAYAAAANNDHYSFARLA